MQPAHQGPMNRHGLSYDPFELMARHHIEQLEREAARYRLARLAQSGSAAATPRATRPLRRLAELVRGVARPIAARAAGHPRHEPVDASEPA